MPVAEQFKSLHFRSIGPATMSGRICRPRRLRGESGDLLRRRPRTAACGRPRATARRSSPLFQDAGTDLDRRRRRSRRRTPTSSGSAPASRTTARAPRGAAASTSRPTAARRSQHMGLAEFEAHQPHRHRPDQQRHRARRGDRPALRLRAAIAASTRRPTAAAPGSRC